LIAVEGCTVVDARKRVKRVITDLRDVAEPGSFSSKNGAHNDNSQSLIELVTR
jgi:hypothetical protein